MPSGHPPENRSPQNPFSTSVQHGSSHMPAAPTELPPPRQDFPPPSRPIGCLRYLRPRDHHPQTLIFFPPQRPQRVILRFGRVLFPLSAVQYCCRII
ncbi:hypothetical protein M405DRAFT_180575 [Rhizopogon salebrosus TDB-379]|nr:hypothetical protein M405DRAFT_180575 [Rhizopogon salebrosus TDB-379]